MKKDIYIVIGQSGAGKGTQAALLREKLKISNPDIDILYLEVGRHFRSLIREDSYTANRVGSFMAEGKLPPPFVAINMWSHDLIYNYKEGQTVIIDGTPRVNDEVPVLLSACEFYDWQPVVFNLEVTDEWAYERTKSRGREDDKDDKDVRERIKWYHDKVEPAIDLLKKSPIVIFHSINGEQSIDSVHKDICKVIGLN